ncbi:MAG: S-layer homology domain-containing protein, partial [Oscillospiraceae bacterium]|nr:S-layer homology domain-containing protein [Oscillospiraceae bacterium]
GSGGFFDVPQTAWFYAPVNWAAERNVTGGVGNGRFGAYDGCTRAQVVTMLWAANGKPEPKSANNPFTDVAGNAWYAKAVLWAVENGITTGVSDTMFGPDRTCTRAQIVTFLYAAAKKPPISGENPFKDVGESDWFLIPVLWAAEEGVTGGIGEGKFGPNDVCTRAQVVTFLHKVFGSD